MTSLPTPQSPSDPPLVAPTHPPAASLSADSPSQHPVGHSPPHLPGSSDPVPSLPVPAWPRWVRCLVSSILLFHLAGLLVAPATVEPCPRVFQQIYPLFGWWLQLLNMNQGNHFFAPDPGPSTLVEYQLATADGTLIRGRIPDRATQPRLLYHRHFMLTESLGNTPEADRRDRRLIARAMARELLRQYQGRSIELTQLTHEIITPEESRAGVPLDVADSYLPRPLGRYEWADFFPETPR
ncbi:MAG: hypothetical protein ACKO3P_07505 [Planctomycetaceae bacterium]